MTDLRQAAQQALECIERLNAHGWILADFEEEVYAAITALRTALEQQAEPPPEWPLIKNILAEYGLDAIAFVAEWKAAQRQWQGLTDDDWAKVADMPDTFDQGVAWAAARLKERNT